MNATDTVTTITASGVGHFIADQDPHRVAQLVQDARGDLITTANTRRTTVSSELSAEDLVSVARFGGRLGDRGWRRFTATSLDDHTHTVPITQMPDPFPGVNIITHTQGVMTGELSGSYTGINVARIHSATGLITGTIIATGIFTYLRKTGRIECLANAIGNADGLKADAEISIAEGDFEGVTGGMHLEGVPGQPLSVVGWLHFLGDS